MERGESTCVGDLVLSNGQRADKNKEGARDARLANKMVCPRQLGQPLNLADRRRNQACSLGKGLCLRHRDWQVAYIASA